MIQQNVKIPQSIQYLSKLLRASLSHQATAGVQLAALQGLLYLLEGDVHKVRRTCACASLHTYLTPLTLLLQLVVPCLSFMLPYLFTAITSTHTHLRMHALAATFLLLEQHTRECEESMPRCVNQFLAALNVERDLPLPVLSAVCRGLSRWMLAGFLSEAQQVRARASVCARV